MRRAMTSPKRVFIFSIAILTALALGAPSGALAETGLGISSTVSEPGGALVAQMRGWRKPFGSLAKVPNVTGKTQKIAEQMLNGAGFKSVVKPVRTRDPAQEGKVKTQRPPAGQMHPRVMPVALEVWALEKVKGPPRGLSGSEGERLQVQVPNVKGKLQTEAERLLEGKGLRHQVAMRVPTTDRQQVGKVASQSPEAGKTVPRGTKVLLFVSRYMAPPGGGGPPPGWHPPGLGGGGRTSRVNTPGVIGMTKAEAERKLRDAGLKSRVRSLVVTGEKSKGGRVKFHQPPPGMPVLPGTTVALDVYKFDPQGPRAITIIGTPTTTTTTTGQGSGPPKVKILGPDFWNNIVGMKYRDAEAKLRREGYTVNVKRWWPLGSDVSRKDRVTKMYWPGRSNRVGLDVYKYDKDARVVPDVTRIKLGDAKKRLKGAGFETGGSTWVYVTDQSLHCKVQKTSPSAGTSLKKGETVYLDVWTTDPEVSKSPGHPATGYFIGSLITGKTPCHF